MKFLCRTLTAAVLVTTSTFSQAAIIANGDFTTDTGTGLDWLDLDLSLGLSVNQVLAQSGPGGTFDGWQVATRGQIHTFMTNIGWIGPFDPANDLNIGFIENFKAQTTSLLNDPISGFGDTSLTNDPADDLGALSFTFDPIGQLGNSHYTFDSPVSPDFSAQDTGTFLVRASAVPIPGAVWLFVTGLLGLTGVARRRSA